MNKAQRDNLPHTLSRWWRETSAVAALGRIAVVGNSLLAKLISLPHKEVHGYVFLFFASVRAVLNLSLECWQQWASCLGSSLVGLTGTGYHSNLPITHLQGMEIGLDVMSCGMYNVSLLYGITWESNTPFAPPCDVCRFLQFLLPQLKNKSSMGLFSMLCEFRTIILKSSWVFLLWLLRWNVATF